MTSSVRPSSSQTPPSGQGSHALPTWTSPEPQMQEDGEVGRSPDRVEREPSRATSQAVHGSLEVMLLKNPLSQRSQADPSKENPAVHAQVEASRAAKGGAHAQLEEASGADLPMGQAVQTKWLLAARVVEYLKREVG